MNGTLVDGIGRTFRVERLAPGLYLDEDEALHIVISEILEAHGWPDTPENRDMVFQEAQTILRTGAARPP